MTEAETIVDTVDYDGDYVKAITVIRTDSDEYPDGWKYRLHYGTVNGRTVLRYLENRRFSTTRRSNCVASR